MLRLSSLQQALIYTVALGLAGGCMKNRKHDTEDTPDVPEHPVSPEPISAQSSNVGVLDLKVELRDDGMLLHVGNLPAGATLECHLDDKPLSACHDGALYARPLEGDHKISAVAIKDGNTVAIG